MLRVLHLELINLSKRRRKDFQFAKKKNYFNEYTVCNYSTTPIQTDKINIRNIYGTITQINI